MRFPLPSTLLLLTSLCSVPVTSSLRGNDYINVITRAPGKVIVVADYPATDLYPAAMFSLAEIRYTDDSMTLLNWHHDTTSRGDPVFPAPTLLAVWREYLRRDEVPLNVLTIPTTLLRRDSRTTQGLELAAADLMLPEYKTLRRKVFRPRLSDGPRHHRVWGSLMQGVWALQAQDLAHLLGKEVLMVQLMRNNVDTGLMLRFVWGGRLLVQKRTHFFDRLPSD